MFLAGDQPTSPGSLEEAAKNWIEATIKQGQSVPEPYTNRIQGKVALDFR